MPGCVTCLSCTFQKWQFSPWRTAWRLQQPHLFFFLLVFLTPIRSGNNTQRGFQPVWILKSFVCQTEHFLAQSGGYPQKHPWQITARGAEAKAPPTVSSSAQLHLECSRTLWVHINSDNILNRPQVKTLDRCNSLTRNSIWAMFKCLFVPF